MASTKSAFNSVKVAQTKALQLSISVILVNLLERESLSIALSHSQLNKD
ncbi:MAG: hypothetical protein JGK17_16310 [Microcoleus sp. PH2017_10_PVI_O_A]|nr:MULTISPECIES: hypothetical protein [unclassified Microcoleus]MCC3407124.1 hypothetical protein [Microcoleus sp. PH2017_10_PVI_O_A]MCC3461134.1 hypothetical protein [Microcoleus sp. PH2017_11_PCY_U_A]MCC3479650.1 hypothetical protein [Microcoleus sp. PH2017_12_PCY_D_A]MCC3531861.1 hypothetical protein [Microcoleus sp. PH2017_21_RUC_O_A]MCC3544194.1 hypothetical protein [Microcoleus sp. PH2017_22_RUC_O_B]